MICRYVITLAPPDLPFPFEEIAMRILKQLCPSGDPFLVLPVVHLPVQVNLFLRKDIFLQAALTLFKKRGRDNVKAH